MSGQAAARTLRAMEALAVQPRSAPQLAAALGIHPRTARRLLQQLAVDGYVTAEGYVYRPTMRVVALAGQVIERADLTAAAVPHVRELHEELGMAAHLCVPSHVYALCLVHAAGRSRCRPQLRELVPCHCTAAGKALLAWRDQWREAVLNQPLEAFTDRTRTGPEYLRRELRMTVARGYAVEDGEYEPRTRGVAVPVPHAGEVVAAVGVNAPAGSFGPDDYEEVASLAGAAAARLAFQLERS